MKNANLERIAAIAEIQTPLTKNEILFAFHLIKGRKIQRKHQVSEERLMAIIAVKSIFGYKNWMQIKELFRLVSLFKEYPEVADNRRFQIENGDFSSFASMTQVGLIRKFGKELNPLVTILAKKWNNVLELESLFAPSESRGLNADVVVFDEIVEPITMRNGSKINFQFDSTQEAAKGLGMAFVAGESQELHAETPIIEVKITPTEFGNVLSPKNGEDAELFHALLATNAQKGAEAGEKLRDYLIPVARFIDENMKEFIEQYYSEDYETAKKMLLVSEMESPLIIQETFQVMKYIHLAFQLGMNKLYLEHSIEKSLEVHLRVIKELAYRGLHKTFNHPNARKYMKELFIKN
jgi:hypothetical protein